jgi:hypothetical protein
VSAERGNVGATIPLSLSHSAPDSAQKPLKTKCYKIKMGIYPCYVRKSTAAAVYAGDEGVDGVDGGTGDSSPPFEPLSV